MCQGGGLVKNTPMRRAARSLVDAPQTGILFCKNWFKTIRKKTVRLNCAARRFAAQQRSLGRVDGYFRRLKSVGPGGLFDYFLGGTVGRTK